MEQNPKSARDRRGSGRLQTTYRASRDRWSLRDSWRRLRCVGSVKGSLGVTTTYEGAARWWGGPRSVPTNTSMKTFPSFTTTLRTLSRPQKCATKYILVQFDDKYQGHDMKDVSTHATTRRQPLVRQSYVDHHLVVLSAKARLGGPQTVSASM